MSVDNNVNGENVTDSEAEDDVDDLDAFIAECTKRNPDFPKLMEAAAQRRREARARGEDPNAEPEDADDEAEEQSTAPHATR